MSRLRLLAISGGIVAAITACLTIYVVHLTSVAIDNMHYSSIK